MKYDYTRIPIYIIWSIGVIIISMLIISPNDHSMKWNIIEIIIIKLNIDYCLIGFVDLFEILD